MQATLVSAPSPKGIRVQPSFKLMRSATLAASFLAYSTGGNHETIYEYLDSFIGDRNRRQEKMVELFNKAFQFISSPVYWQAIERLAGYILHNRENTISCEEAIAELDKSISEEYPVLSLAENPSI
jgi:hypothetical protein